MKLALASLVALLATFATPRRGAQEAQFGYVDVFLDSGRHPLAAWQIELRDPSSTVQIVGVEGGDGPAFAEPARYDPRALQAARIVLAALSTEDELPSGRIRVARLHLRFTGSDLPQLEALVRAAATLGAERIDVLIELTPPHVR